MRRRGADDTNKLIVATYSPGLAAAFRGTAWAGSAARGGGWITPLLRMAGAKRVEHPVRFGGYRSRAISLPLADVMEGLLKDGAGPLFGAGA